MSRPEITINWKKVEDLMVSGCSGVEIAAHIGVHKDTLYDRTLKEKGMNYSDYSAEKKAKGESLLKAQQFAKALGVTKEGDNMMLIWLGKNRLGQKENHEEKQSPKEEDIELKQKYYALQYEMIQLKERYNDSKPQASQELQRSDTQV